MKRILNRHKPRYPKGPGALGQSDCSYFLFESYGAHLKNKTIQNYTLNGKKRHKTCKTAKKTKKKLPQFGDPIYLRRMGDHSPVCAQRPIFAYCWI